MVVPTCWHFSFLHVSNYLVFHSPSATHSCDHILDFIITNNCKTLHDYNLKHSFVSDTYFIPSSSLTSIVLPHHKSIDSTTFLLFLTSLSPHVSLSSLNSICFVCTLNSLPPLVSTCLTKSQRKSQLCLPFWVTDERLVEANPSISVLNPNPSHLFKVIPPAFFPLPSLNFLLCH